MTDSGKREIRPGMLVEFFEKKKLLCAVCLEVKNNRLLVLTEQDREANVAMKRILQAYEVFLDLSLGRVQLVAALREAAVRRQDLMSRISVEELWDLLQDEEEGFDCQQLAEICFSGEIGADQLSALLRALLSDNLHFKYRSGLFYANSAGKLEQIRLQQQRQAQKERELAKASGWLAAVWEGKATAEPENRQRYIQMLKEFYLFGPDAPEYQQTKKILAVAQIPMPHGVFQLLVKLGIWKEDENLYLHRFGIRQDFPPEVLHAAAQVARAAGSARQWKEEAAREDLTALPVLTIDGPTTRDYDDALSVRTVGHDIEVGIHIADAARFVRPGSELDKAALQRATSLYLPDINIPMLPALLSEGLCSLRQGEERLALSLLVNFDESYRLQGFRFVLSRVKVQRQLTYGEANELVATDPALGYLFGLATRLRRQRVADGALPLPLPELRVWVNSSGEIHISRVDRETPAQLVVSELMILANALAARELVAREVPAIYRSQEKPQEVVVGEGSEDLYLNYLQRRYLGRAKLRTTPTPHSGLGLEAYTSWTSPIRRYVDLVVQRQLKCMVRGASPLYGRQDLENIVAQLTLPQSQAMLVKREWTRYWVLKYFQKKQIKALDALVLEQGRRTYRLLLPEYLLEASIPLEEGRDLKPGDWFRVIIVRVSAREELLKLRMA